MGLASYKKWSDVPAFARYAILESMAWQMLAAMIALFAYYIDRYDIGLPLALCSLYGTKRTSTFIMNLPKP